VSCAVVLAPPRAYALLPVVGRYRVEPEDFRVEEALAFVPDGAGEHLFLEIEKRLRNSEDVARALVDAFAVEPVDVSYAGRKDRRALTRQWFSVRTPRDDVPALPAGCRVQRVSRHARKLRRGELAQNRFTLRVRDLAGPVHSLAERLALLASGGAPNYFGPQRFGRDGANLGRAFRYLTARPRRNVGATERGLHLSVGRALLFNVVLAARVEGSLWAQPIPGDVLHGDDPTGPLWGRGRAPVGGEAAVLESRALAGYAPWCHALEHVGLGQERRALVARPKDLVWSLAAGVLDLSFSLGPGQYASVLLRELGELASATGEATG
jgi:tRNA pseudouridine13 synthase